MRFQSILLLVLLLYSQSSNVLAPPPLSLYRRRLLEKQKNNSLKMNLSMGPIMSQPLLARSEEPSGFWATMLKIAEFMPAVRIFRLPFG